MFLDLPDWIKTSTNLWCSHRLYCDRTPSNPRQDYHILFSAWLGPNAPCVSIGVFLHQWLGYVTLLPLSVLQRNSLKSSYRSRECPLVWEVNLQLLRCSQSMIGLSYQRIPRLKYSIQTSSQVWAYVQAVNLDRSIVVFLRLSLLPRVL